MLNKFRILCFVLFIPHLINGQITDVNSTKPHSSFFDHLFFGGNLGVQVGNQTYIEVSPQIGYKITERLSAGISTRYIYYKYKEPTFSYSTSIYGGGLFSRYFIFENFFTHLEYEVLNLSIPDLYGRNYRTNIESVFIGGGYRQEIGEHSALDLLLLYNLNDSRYSPYVNPIIRFGFAFGI